MNAAPGVEPVGADLPSAPAPLPPGERDPWPSFLRTFFVIGLNTFGGPVAQLGVMHREVVERRRWLTDGQFVHLLNFANLLPGPEALEVCIHLGYLRRGVWGGIASGLLFLWPGFVSLTLLAWAYVNHGDVFWVGAALDGIRPVAVALIAAAAMRLSSKALEGTFSYALMLGAFAASYFGGVPFLALLGGCALVGIALGRRTGPSLARFERPLVLVLLGVALTAGLWGPRVLQSVDGESRAEGGPGAGTTESQSVAASAPRDPPSWGSIALLNTQAALVTFGGAYTVLPFFREQYVERKGWLTDRQVADALALGETTPGPLMCIGVFLGFLAGGLSGATVACVFLFLPSFVLVLGLGRYVEAVERLPFARGLLRGVSAGTLGLILSLAAQLVPSNLQHPASYALAAVAFGVLWRFKMNPLYVVVAGAVMGVVSAGMSS